MSMRSISASSLVAFAMLTLITQPTAGQWHSADAYGRPSVQVGILTRNPDVLWGMAVSCMRSGEPQVLVTITEISARLKDLGLNEITTTVRYEFDTPGGTNAPFPEDVDLAALSSFEAHCDSESRCLAHDGAAWELLRSILSGTHRKISFAVMGMGFALPLNNAVEELLTLSCVKDRMGFKAPGDG